MSHKIGLLTPSAAYKPFRYPWAFELWQQQQRVHWIPEEVPLGEDCKDWANNLSEAEKNLLTHIFRFFTQADIDVNDNYMDRYAQLFKPTEIKMMLSAFSNIETIHVAAYSLLIDTVGMPDHEYSAFMEYEAMRAKHDYGSLFKVNSHEATLQTLAMFGAFTEGLQLFASFAMLMNFPRFNKMKGMGQIVTWSIRDESLHCEGMIKLFHVYAQECNGLKPHIKDSLIQHCKNVVANEDKFIDLAFELGPVQGMSADDIKQYIRYIADWRLDQLGLDPIYNIVEHPLPWLAPLLNGVEHANFFEARATEYSKGATKGTWNDVWEDFERVKNVTND